jgi:hypothetical protein
MTTLARAELVTFGVVITGACGYALAGRGVSLPPHIQVINIPQFQNQSSTAEVDQVITAAVQQEFQSHRRFRTISEPTGGDAILRGVITGVRSNPIAFDPVSQQATRLEIVVTANVEFVDLKDNNKVLWSRTGWQAREEYDISAGVIVSDPSALFRQDTNALYRLARTLARSLVTSILDAF